MIAIVTTGTTSRVARYSPCCDWDEFLGDKLGDTIYVDMPNSIRTGRVSQRGSRGSRGARDDKNGGKKGGGGKKVADKENSAGESSDEEGQCS